MPIMGILVVGILIVIIFLAVTTAIVAAAPYIAIGVVVALLIKIAFGKDKDDEDKQPPA